MNIRQNPQFKRDFADLPERIQQRAKDKLGLFLQNPRHPSLRTKKMKGHKNLWEGRITEHYRFIYTLEQDTYVLLNIGPHDILKNP